MWSNIANDMKHNTHWLEWLVPPVANSFHRPPKPTTLGVMNDKIYLDIINQIVCITFVFKIERNMKFSGTHSHLRCIGRCDRMKWITGWWLVWPVVKLSVLSNKSLSRLSCPIDTFPICCGASAVRMQVRGVNFISHWFIFKCESRTYWLLVGNGLMNSGRESGLPIDSRSVQFILRGCGGRDKVRWDRVDLASY